MNNIEWEEFITELVKRKDKTNIKKLCKDKGVGLETLYRKVSILKETNPELYKEFNTKYPYIPRDIKGVDFEQLMRESILFGISQSELEEKYGITKRTIQRRFKKIKNLNQELYGIYERYTSLKKGEELDSSFMLKVSKEYIPQDIPTIENTLQVRRKEFLKRIQDIENSGEKKEKQQTYNHYKEQITRVEQAIEARDGKGE